MNRTENTLYKDNFQKDNIQVVKPNVLYYGTPVILLTTLNEDGTSNITPMSSSWALGNCIVLGLGLGGKGLENMQRHGECVLNIPNPKLWKSVEAIAPLTGKNPVPEYKQSKYRYEKDKFEVAGFTRLTSELVKPDRIGECPLQIEAKVLHIRRPEHTPLFAIIEVEAVRVHAHEGIILDETHINPTEWSPLLYNFRHYFGLGKELGRTFKS